MANQEQLEFLYRGIDSWNQWRKNNPEIQPDLSGAKLINQDLSRAVLDGTNLEGADLSKAQLSHATLHGANLESATLILADLLGAVLNEANLSGTSFFGAFLFGTRLKSSNLKGANLLGASLMGADLTGADLSGAHLMGANFHEANLQNAVFRNSNLTAASLVGAQVQGAEFDQCSVHGISAWNLEGIPQIQRELVLTSGDKCLSVDNLELAQIVNPILFSSQGSKLVKQVSIKAGLIIGRFKSGRENTKEVLRSHFQTRHWNLIMAQLDTPGDRTINEYLAKLVKMVGFIVVDLSRLKPFRSFVQSMNLSAEDLPVIAIRDSKTEALNEIEREITQILVYESADDLNKQLSSVHLD